MIKIVHIITDLSTGGAEMMLYKLLSRMDRSSFEARVVSLMDIGTIGEKIRVLGVPVKALEMRRGIPNPVSILRLSRWLSQDPPHAIQTWMYHPDLIGGLAAKLAGNIPVAWGIRHSDIDLHVNKRSTIWTARACACLSRWLPVRIVCCSEASRRVHAKLHYAAERMVVIPNGFDLEVFRPNPEARVSVRRELGIPKEALLIGLVGRFDPQKDHHTFVQAAARLNLQSSGVHFLLCGNNVTWENQDLVDWIEASGIRDCCHLLGGREDIQRLTAALDISCSSSSSGEGFPNVIGEAMACGVSCVATDVGDSALLVGDTGRIVPPKNPPALAGGLQELIDMDPEGRNQLGLAARRHIEEHFNLSAIVAKYERLYREIGTHKKPSDVLSAQ